MPAGLNFQANIDLSSFNRAITEMVNGLNAAQRKITELTSQSGAQAEKVFKAVKIDPTGVTGPLTNVLSLFNQIGQQLDVINRKSAQIKWTGAFAQDTEVRQASSSLNLFIQTLFKAADAMESVGKRMQTKRFLSRTVLDEDGKSVQQLTRELLQLEKAFNSAQKASMSKTAIPGVQDELKFLRQEIRETEAAISSLKNKMQSFGGVGGVLQSQGQSVTRYAAALLEGYNAVLEIGKSGQAAPPATRYTPRETYTSTMPSLAKEVGSEFAGAWVRNLFALEETFQNSIRNALQQVMFKLKTGIDLSAEGVSLTQVQSSSDRLAAQLRATMKATANLMSSPELFKIVETMGIGDKPPEALVKRLGERLDRMTKFLWKRVDDYAAQVGEGRVESVGATGVISAAETRAKLLPEIRKLSIDILRHEKEGADLWADKIAKLRAYRQELVGVLKYSEAQGGITGVSTAMRTGPEFTVGTKLKTAISREVLNLDEVERSLERILGLESRIAREEDSQTQTVKQRESISGGAYQNLQRTAALLERMRTLVTGAAVPEHEIASMLQASRQLENLIARSTKIGAFDPEVVKVINTLPLAFGKTAGYVQREIPGGITETSAFLRATIEGLAGLDKPAVAPFKAHINALHELDKQVRGLSFKELEPQISAVHTLLGEALTDPQTKLPQLYSAIGKLNTLLESTANKAAQVRERAISMFESVNIDPIVSKFRDLESLWSAPKGKTVASELNVQMRQLFGSFKEEGAEKPLHDILVLWEQIYKIVLQYHEAIKRVPPGAAGEQELSRIRKSFGPAFELAAQELNTGFQGAKEPLMILNTLNDAFRKTAFGARDLFNVSANATGLLENTRNLALLTHQAVSGSLPAEYAASFERMRKSLESATVVVKSEHLPALETVLKTVTNLEAVTRKYVGGSLYRTQRGLLPEWLYEQYNIRTAAAPFAHQGFSLEEALSGVGGTEITQGGKPVFIPAMGRYLTRMGDEISEYFQMFGAQLKPTAAQAAFPGSFEVVDVALKKIQNLAKHSLQWSVEQLSKHELPVTMFEPTVTEYIPKLIERLGIAQKVTGGAVEGRPEIASLSLTLGNTKRQLEIVQALYRNLFSIIKSGKPVSEELFQSMEQRAAKLSRSFERGLIKDTKKLIGNLRQYVHLGEAVPEAIHEALKLPTMIDKTPSGIIEMLGGKVGGGKTFLETLDPAALLRVEMGLTEARRRAMTEIQRPDIQEMLLSRIEWSRRLVGSRIASMPTEAWPKNLYEQLSPEMQQSVGTTLTGITKARVPTVSDTFKAIKEEMKQTASATKKGAEEVLAAEETIPAGIDKISKQKVDALSHQRAGMAAEIEKTAKVISQETGTLFEAHENAAMRARDRASKATAEDEKLFAQVMSGEKDTWTEEGRLKKAVGEKGKIDVTNMLQSVQNRLAELSHQYEVFGHAVSNTGTPMDSFAKGMQAINLQINSVIKEMSKAGGLAPTLDDLVKNFNEAAAPGTQVKSISQHWVEIEQLREEISLNRQKYLAAKQARGLDTPEGRPAAEMLNAARQKEVELLERLKEKRIEMLSTMDALMSKENMERELVQREAAAIEDLGLKYRLLRNAAETGMGSIAERTAHLEPLQKAEEIARQSLISASWQRGGREYTGQLLFQGLESPAATPSDILSKLLPPAAERGAAGAPGALNFFMEMGTQAERVLRVFERLNSEMRLGFQPPKTGGGFQEYITFILSELEKVQMAIETHGPSAALKMDLMRLQNALKQEGESTFQFISNVYEKISQQSKELREQRVGIDFAERMKKATDEVVHMSTELQSLSKTFRQLKAEGKGAEFRIPAYEAGAEAIAKARQILFQAQRDAHAPQKDIQGLAEDIKEAQAAQKGMLSLWERLTNTIKTSRNTMADLFLYQVRWYSSMIVFWGIFNKITGLFEEMMHAQFEIERATINLRESSGEVVANYDRLEKIARGAIFESMVRWGYTAKDAAEGLYQLGSAGLTAREAMAALGPALAMVMGTTADMRESVKTLAGLYNVLNSSMSPLDAVSQGVGLSTASVASSIASAADQGAKFRRISDVLTMVFRDHQVEMNELNRGYQFAISSSDLAGLTFEQLSAILAILNDNMIKSSRAGRGLNQIIGDMARDPYAVMGSFKEMAMSLKLPEDRAREVQRVLAGWDFSKMKNKSMFDALGELARLINATGVDIGVLSRIFESFGILGGRAVAPLLKHWGDIERETIRLSISAAGASEMMAERMSNTLEKGLLKVSAYFQQTFYDVMQTIHITSKGIVLAFASIGEAATRAGEAASRGVEVYTGPGFLSGLINGTVRALPLIVSLAGVFSMLGGVLPRVAAFFPNLGASVLFFVGSLVTAIPALRQFTVLQNLFTLAFPGAGIVKLALGILSVAGVFGLLSGVYKKFFEDTDSLVAKSEATWAEYNAELAKSAQKQKEVWAQADYIQKTRTALEKELQGRKAAEAVPDELTKKYRLYAVSVGATEEVEKKRFKTVGELKEAVEGLSEAQEKALREARQSSLLIVNSANAERLYAKAMQETEDVLKRVARELEEINRLRREGQMGPGLGAEAPVWPTGRPLSPDEEALLKRREQFVKFTGKAAEETKLRQAREALLSDVFSLFSPEDYARAKQAAEGSGEGYKQAIELFRRSFARSMQELSSAIGGEQNLADKIFPMEKGAAALKRYRVLMGEWQNEGKLFTAFFAKLAKEQSLPLGEEVGKKVTETIHRENMKRLQDEVQLTSKQIQMNKERIEQIKLTRTPDWGEVDRLIAENNALENQSEVRRKALIAEEKSFQTKRLIRGSEKDAATMRRVEAEYNLRMSEVELDRLRRMNEHQKAYQQLMSDWVKRTLPELRRKQIEGSLQPGGTFGLAPGAGQDSVKRVFEAMKPGRGVTQEQLQGYLNILADQVRSFGYGPKMLKLLTALMAHESRFVESAESPKKAQGLMQVMPSNLRAFGVPENLFKDPLQNIRAALRLISNWDAKYNLGLKDIETMNDAQFEKVAKMFLSMYNSGPGNVRKALEKGKVVPDITETQNLVSDVLNRYKKLSPVVLGTGAAIRGELNNWVEKLLRDLEKPPIAGVQPLPAEAVKKILLEVFQLLPTTLPEGLQALSPDLRQRMFALAQKVGVGYSEIFKLSNAEIQRQLEAGHMVPPADIDRFFENYRKTFLIGMKKVRGDREMREMGLKFIQSILSFDFNWRPENFNQTMETIFKIGEQANISKTKIYNMITIGFNPEIMKEALRGNMDLTTQYFQQMEAAFKRFGYVPTKLYENWEKAIHEMLNIGDVFTEKQLRNWAELLKALPVKKLTEDAGAFAKYFTLLAARQDIKTDDLRLLSDLMKQFGASADEIWKAFGDVADQQIRRIRASWYEAGSGVKNDLKEAASLGDAMWWSMTKGIAEFASKIRDPFKMMADSISGVLETMKGTLEEILTDFGMRQPKTMQEYINKMAEGFTKIGAKNLSEQIMGGFTDLLAGSFGIPSELLAGLKSPQQLQKEASEAAIKTAVNTERTAAATEAMAASMGTGFTPTLGEGMPSEVGVEVRGGGLSSGSGGVSQTKGGGGSPGFLSGLFGKGLGGGFSFSSIPLIGPFISLISQLFSGIGKWFGFKRGGFVPGFGHGDIVPAMLEPGEFVVPRSIVKRFQEGGEISFDSEEMQTLFGGMIGDMVGSMFEPYREMFDPTARIGEGYYGPAFERQMQFQAYMDQAYQMDFQKKMAKSNAETQAYIQSVLSQPSGLQMGLQLFKGLMSFPFGIFASGGLVPQYFSSGGLQGPTLTPQSESSKPWLYANPRMVSQKKDSGQTTPQWWQTLLSISGGLMGPLMALNKAFGGSGKTTVGQAALSNQSLFNQAMAGADRTEAMANMAQAKLDTFLAPDLGVMGDYTPTFFEPSSLLGGFEGMASFFDFGSFFPLFAKGGAVPKWAAKFAQGGSWLKGQAAKIPDASKYFPTSGPGSSTAANYTYSSSSTSAAGSYWPALLLALLPLLMMGLKLGKGKTPQAKQAADATAGAQLQQEDPGFFSKLWSGFKGLFGFQSGGEVGWFDWLGSFFGPSQAFAMAPSEILPTVSAGWETGLNRYVEQGMIPAHQGSDVLTQAKLGVQDVVTFMKDKPFFFSPITSLSGKVGPVAGGVASEGLATPAAGAIDMTLTPYAPLNPDVVRANVQNTLLHETVHVLSKSGQPLAPWNEVIDPKVAYEWAQKAYPKSEADWLKYVSEPSEVVARGVAAHLQMIMNPNYETKQDWPAEYDTMFKELAAGLAKGELPQSPQTPGFMDKVSRSVYEMVKVGRYPSDMSRFLRGFQTGGQIPGIGHGDTVPAWLTPGEFVINRGTVDFFGPHFFAGLQEMAKAQKSGAIAHVAQAAQQAQQFAQGGVVKKGPSPTTSTTSTPTGTKMQGAAASSPEVKMTVVTVVDDSSLDQFLNTKKYGDVLVNKLGSRISRRMSGGRAL